MKQGIHETKPCPFCGQDQARLYKWGVTDDYSVHCDNCNAQTDAANNETDAVALWNTRAEQ